jgi:hypothetical protein
MNRISLMCFKCFNLEYSEFKVEEDFLTLYHNLKQKVNEGTLLLLESNLHEPDQYSIRAFGVKFAIVIGSTYDLYQCNHCKTYWRLSIPENASRGFFKKGLHSDGK